MTFRTTLVSSVLAVALLLSGAVFAQKATHNISEKKHPNLAAAQNLCDRALTRITDAQKANEWDMDGHAAKAKELLDQANRELKQAAEAANKNAK